MVMGLEFGGVIGFKEPWSPLVVVVLDRSTLLTATSSTLVQGSPR